MANFDQVAVDTIADAQRTIAFDAALSLVCSLVSEFGITFWNAPRVANNPDRRQVDGPAWLVNPSGEDPEYGLNDFLYQALVSLVARGNLWCRALDSYTETQGRTVLRQADILYPELVTARPSGPNGDSVMWMVEGAEDKAVRHWRAEPLPGVLLGPSLIHRHAISLKVPQVAGMFGAQFFTDGGHPSSLLTNDYADNNTFGGTGAKRLKDEFLASTRGRREPLVLGRGWKYQRVSVTPEESQFLKTLAYGQADVARIFGPGIAEILGYEAGSGMTYANLEGRTSHLLIFAIGKWVKRAERFLRAFCPRKVFPQLESAEMVNATPQQLYKNVEILAKNGLVEVNEARRMISLPPTDWGNRPNPIAGANVTQDGAPPPDPTGGTQ